MCRPALFFPDRALHSSVIRYGRPEMNGASQFSGYARCFRTIPASRNQSALPNWMYSGSGVLRCASSSRHSLPRGLSPIQTAREATRYCRVLILSRYREGKTRFPVSGCRSWTKWPYQHWTVTQRRTGISYGSAGQGAGQWIRHGSRDRDSRAHLHGRWRKTDGGETVLQQ